MRRRTRTCTRARCSTMPAWRSLSCEIGTALASSSIIGLCSGGYTGFHAALVEPEVEGVVLLNPQMLLWTRDATAVTRAGILRAEFCGWQPGRPSSGDRGAVLRHVAPPWVARWSPSCSWRASLLIRRLRAYARCGSGQCLDREDPSTGSPAAAARLLFVFSGGDNGLGYLERHLGFDYEESLRRRGVAMRVVEGTDHLFRPLWSQDTLQGIVEEHFRACRFPLTRVETLETVVLKVVISRR